ncbi:MFS transporter [Clostridium botulinum]|uniref:MFS transporter n=1 Tax=Clostridium botulinum TaxID=1491 RepID=A0A6M0SR37_CLOBO|nr:MFS transporter [Clostridium botulinum]
MRRVIQMSKLNRNIKILIIGSCLSSVGDWLNILALMTLVVKLSDYGGALAVLMILRAMPKIIFGPFIAGIIDKLNKKKALLITCIISSILVLLIPLSKNIYEIYIISCFLSTINIVVSPTIRSIIPSIVKDDELISVNSIFSSLNSIIDIVSPILSGIILTIFGLSKCFYIDSISFIVFGIMLIFLKLNYSNNNSQKISYNFVDICNNSKRSLKYILDNMYLFKVLQGMFLANLSMGIIYVSEIIFLKIFLGIDPDMYGSFVSIVGIGLVIGSILISKLHRFELYNLFSFGVYLMGVTIVFFSFSNKLYFLIPLLIIEGIGEAFFSITSITIIQQNTNESNRASVLTLNDSLSKVAYIVSMGCAGILIDIIGAKYTILISGIISALYFIIWIKNYTKTMETSVTEK